MSRLSSGCVLALLLGCGPKAPPVAPTPPPPPVDANAWRAAEPPLLAPRPFALPQAERGTLSNGLPVLVVRNTEVPKVYVRLAFKDGGWTDPANRPGLASASMDLMNEGAGTLSAEALSAALRRLASDLGTSAGTDGAVVSLSSLKKNLEPSLDLLALVVQQPTFSKTEWALLQKQRIADLRTELEDPAAIARRAFPRVLYGDTYLGHTATEASYQAMTAAELKGWAQAHLRPDRAMVLVGGDITLAEVQPMLEARLGGWKASGKAPTATPDTSTLKAPAQTTVFLIDKPGASQSVLRLAVPVGNLTDPDMPSFDLANTAVGGLFSARINMNLREDKGYTYGARSFVQSGYGRAIWAMSTSVRADATVDALKETLRELSESRTSRPVTAAELEYMRGNALGTFPLDYETPGDYLDGLVSVWRYGLPENWIPSGPDRVRAVTLDSANAAWQKHLDTDHLAILVVGDAASHRAGLAGLGFPVVELDRDGNPLKK